MQDIIADQYLPVFDVSQTSEAILSYSFGQLLYEMVMCRPLSAAMMETTPPDMAAAISEDVAHLNAYHLYCTVCNLQDLWWSLY